MNDKNYITQADDREETIPDKMRYTYIGSSVEIDGKSYPVVAAIPLGTADCSLPSAEEKLMKLVQGK